MELSGFCKRICTAIFIFHWISFVANIDSLNLALGRPCGCEENDREVPYLRCHIRGLVTVVTLVQ